MGAPKWEVFFVDLGRDEDAFDEFIDQARPTPRQIARCRKQLDRFGDHGFQLDGDYFDNVEGSKRKLKEFRVIADKVAYRFLFVQRGSRFVMLKGFKHTNLKDVAKHIDVAERRLTNWEETNEAE